MWLSSCARTPSSSMRFILSSRPVVTAMAACFGSRPVANAFGASSSTMYTRGFGRPAAMHKPSMMLCSRAYSTGSAGRARLIRSATASDFQYDTADMPRAITRAITTPTMPNRSRKFSATATSIANTTNAAISSADRRLLEETWSYSGSCPGLRLRPGGRRGRCRFVRRRRRARRGGGGVEGHMHRIAGGLLDLEVFASGEVEHPRDDDRGEGLDLRVVALHGVVVELPRVGDAAFRTRQLLLKVQEVLVGLEVGIRLGQREERLQRAADHVLGLRLLCGALRAHGHVPGLDHGFEGLTLVGGVALDGLDEVRDQVVAALQLHVDLRPRIVDSVAQPDQPVERAD